MNRSVTIVWAIAGASLTAKAELARVSISGVVTSAMTSAGEFAGMRVGDTWTFEMLVERDPAPSHGNGLDFSSEILSGLAIDQTRGFDLVSASFSTRVGSISVSEFDLASFNSLGTILPSGSPSPEMLAEAAANRRFDLFVTTYNPASLRDSGIAGLSDLPLVSRLFRQQPDTADLGYLESVLPQDLFGATAAGERWASINLNGAVIDSVITDYFIAPVGGRSIPTPAGVSVMAAICLVGSRRRR